MRARNVIISTKIRGNGQLNTGLVLKKKKGLKNQFITINLIKLISIRGTATYAWGRGDTQPPRTSRTSQEEHRDLYLGLGTF